MSRSVNMSPAFSAPYGIKVRYQSKYITAFLTVGMYGGYHSYSLCPKISKRRCKKALNKVMPKAYEWVYV